MSDELKPKALFSRESGTLAVAPGARKINPVEHSARTVKESVIPKTELEQEQFPVPEREDPQFLEDDYIPAAMRNPSRLTRETQAGSLWQGVKNNLSDNSFGLNTARFGSDAIREALDADTNDFHVIQAAMPSVLEKYGLTDAAIDPILEEATSVEHAEELADRIRRVNANDASAADEGIGQMIVSGIGGFALDPTNWLLVTKGLQLANSASRATPTIAKAVTATMATKKGKVAALATFGAVEEAVRMSPRLANDPSYNYERYLTDVATGAVFSAGIGISMPAGRWAAGKLKEPYDGVMSTISNYQRKVAESQNIRTSANLVKSALKESTQVRKVSDVTKMFGDDAVEAAVHKAQTQVKESKLLGRIDNSVASVVKTLTDTPESIHKSFVTSMKDILDAAVPPEKGKVRVAIRKFNKWIDDLAATDTKRDDSVGAAKRKETTATKIDDAVHDVKQSTKEAIDSIEEVREQALSAIGKGTDKVTTRAVAAINAAADMARRATEAKAERVGVKPTRTAVDPQVATTKAKEHFDNTSVNVGKLGKQIEATLKNHGIKLSRGGMSKLMSRVFKDLPLVKTTDDGTGKTVTHIVDWITSGNHKVAVERAQDAREAVTREFLRLRDEIEDSNLWDASDPKFLEAKRQLAELQDQLESTLDWAGMLKGNIHRDVSNLPPKWALLSKEFEDSMGDDIELLYGAYEKLSQRFISKQFGRLTESLSAKLVRTRVPLATYIATHVLELPAGTGGTVDRKQTAAILARMFEEEHTTVLNKAWLTMMDAEAAHQKMNWISRGILRTTGANSHKATQDVARKVMLEMNSRQQGIVSDNADHILAFADALETFNKSLYDLQLKNNLDGITGNNQMNNYMKQSWNDGKIMELYNDPNFGRDNLIDLLSESMFARSKGTLDRAATRDYAEAVIDLKIGAMGRRQVDDASLRTNNMNTTMARLDEILARMNKNGKYESMERVLKYTETNDIGGASYVQKRIINLDYNTKVNIGGKDTSIMELLDNDVIGVANRYAKEAAGRSALASATNGRLNSEHAVNELIEAVGAQAADMGTYVNTKDLRNVFRQIMGLPYDGQLPMDVRKIRDAVALAGMNGLGESQLAELGLAVNRGSSGMYALNQVASKAVGKIKQWRHLELTEKQMNDIQFLDDLQEFSKLYDDMHIMARNNVHFDTRAPEEATNLLSKMVDKGTGGKFRPTLQYLQTRYTGYGAIRTMEEQLAMAGLMQDALKSITTGKSFTTAARFKDIGLDIKLLKKKLDDGTILLDEKGKIKTLNVHKWSQLDQESLGVALRRHAGQQVQMGFAGEMSPLMTNPMVAMLMQFKSYPMLAAEKQMGRNAMFADKEAAMGITLNAASSGAARIIRYHSLAAALPSDKREAYLERRMELDFNHDTAAYMGIVGMMVNNADMANDLIFGNRSIASQIPVTNWADNYLKGIKAANPTDGITERDVGNMQRGAPLGTIMYVNGLAGIIRNLMDTDTKNDYKSRSNRGS